MLGSVVQIRVGACANLAFWHTYLGSQHHQGTSEVTTNGILRGSLTCWTHQRSTTLHHLPHSPALVLSVPLQSRKNDHSNCTIAAALTTLTYADVAAATAAALSQCTCQSSTAKICTTAAALQPSCLGTPRRIRMLQGARKQLRCNRPQPRRDATSAEGGRPYKLHPSQSKSGNSTVKPSSCAAALTTWTGAASAAGIATTQLLLLSLLLPPLLLRLRRLPALLTLSCCISAHARAPLPRSQSLPCLPADQTGSPACIQ